MILKIVSPKARQFSCETPKVFFPGIDGSFEVLDNHAAMIAVLGKGDIRWEGPDGAGSFSISSGFVEVGSNCVTAVVEQ